MIVAIDGSGDFRTLQEAIDAAPADRTTPFPIYIKNGVYKEKIRIEKPFIYFIGEDAAKTVLAYGDYAKKLFPSGETMNTFNSYSLYVGAHDFHAANITFENSAGPGERVGQAVAVYNDADRISYKNCRFLAHQDTVFDGPLPKHPTPLGLNVVHPTLGSGEAEYSGIIRHYFEDCFIRGDIDFIFGSATVVLNRCEIFSNNRHEAVNGFITAASTHPSYRYGYVFLNCRLTGDAGPATVYLGRPWRDYANVAFINCHMGAHIIPAGWHNWDKPERERTVTYVEYGSSGPGANDAARVKWAKILTSKEAREYTVERIFSNPGGWNPTSE